MGSLTPSKAWMGDGMGERERNVKGAGARREWKMDLTL